MNVKTVGIIGHYDTKNFGDLLLAMLVENAIRDAGCKPVFLFGFGPNNGRALWKKFGGVRAAMSVDALVFGGGGYFDGGGRFTIVKHFPFFLATKIVSWRRKRIGIFGAGAGPDLGTFAKFFVRGIIDSATHAELRDRQSISVARSIGVSKEIKECVDLAQTIRKRSDFASLFNEAPPLESKTLLVHADSYFIGGIKSSDAEKVLDALRRFEKPMGWDVVLLFDYLDSPALAEEIELATGYPVRFGLSVQEVLKLIWSATAVVSTKFHVPLVSFTLGKPVWGISRHPKVKDLFDQYERLDRYVEVLSDADMFLKFLKEAVAAEPQEKDIYRRKEQEGNAAKLFDAIREFCVAPN